MLPIYPHMFEGGEQLTPHYGAGSPSLTDALQFVSDDLYELQVPTITSPDATDEASLCTLLNEIKADFNLLAAYVIRVIRG